MDRGMLIASLSTVFIGFSIVVGAVIAKSMHPLVLSLLSYLVAIVFLFVLSKAVKERFQVRELFRGFKRELIEVVLLRSIIGQIILLFGFATTLAIRAVFMVQFESAFVLLYSALLLREKVTARKVGLVLLLLAGGFMFITNLNPVILQEVMPGDWLIILALAFLAYTYIPSAKISKKVNPTTLTITSSILAAIILVPIIGLLLPVGLIAFDMNALVMIVIYSLLFYVFGLFLYFKALGSVKPWVVASVLALQPIAGALLAFFWLGQMVTLVQLVGALIMIIAIYSIARYR